MQSAVSENVASESAAVVQKSVSNSAVIVEETTAIGSESVAVSDIVAEESVEIASKSAVIVAEFDSVDYAKAVDPVELDVVFADTPVAADESPLDISQPIAVEEGVAEESFHMSDVLDQIRVDESSAEMVKSPEILKDSAEVTESAVTDAEEGLAKASASESVESNGQSIEAGIASANSAISSILAAEESADNVNETADTVSESADTQQAVYAASIIAGKESTEQICLAPELDLSPEARAVEVMSSLVLPFRDLQRPLSLVEEEVSTGVTPVEPEANDEIASKLSEVVMVTERFSNGDTEAQDSSPAAECSKLVEAVAASGAAVAHRSSLVVEAAAADGAAVPCPSEEEEGLVEPPAGFADSPERQKRRAADKEQSLVEMADSNNLLELLVTSIDMELDEAGASELAPANVEVAEVKMYPWP
jgi:hypothetical protein